MRSDTQVGNGLPKRRVNLDVDVIFYDTTSLHFEIDEEDEGDANGEAHGSLDAGMKPTSRRWRKVAANI